jgi:hypothetical protein
VAENRSIANARVSVTVKPRGAELCSLRIRPGSLRDKPGMITLEPGKVFRCACRVVVE